MKDIPEKLESVRLDKWLWAARFYKTRTLASESISRGNLKVNDSAAKPSRGIRTGDSISLRKGPYQWQITVNALSEKRGPASEAALLYSEQETSQKNRYLLSQQLKLDRLSRPIQHGRPNKHQRRKILRFKKLD